MAALYLDSSAIVKLVAAEEESEALFAFLRGWDERISSVLARVEVHRAIRRARGTAAERRRADRVLARIALLRIDDPILTLAVRLSPTDLRSLDAIHLATALSVTGPDSAMVTYDDRLARAATAARVRVHAPGAV
jgi:predicted nucleic acid-binding protein